MTTAWTKRALVYLALANRLIHGLRPDAVTLAEDVSGMPGLAAPSADGGIRFRLPVCHGRAGPMDPPDPRMCRTKDWSMGHLWHELTNRRQDEQTVSYAESHDQALVGDQTLIFRMIGPDIYDRMRIGDASGRGGPGGGPAQDDPARHPGHRRQRVSQLHGKRIRPIPNGSIFPGRATTGLFGMRGGSGVWRMIRLLVYGRLAAFDPGHDRLLQKLWYSGQRPPPPAARTQRRQGDGLRTGGSGVRFQFSPHGLPRQLPDRHPCRQIRG